MSKRVVYLLGAGASKNAVPVVADIPEGLARFKKRLKYYFASTTNTYGHPAPATPQEPSVSSLIQTVERLETECAHHASVDTLAKKLFFLRDHQKLKDLKVALGCFLQFEESSKRVDKRYDAFLSYVLDSDRYDRLKLPANVSILTWNYDAQIDKALYGFCEDESFVEKEVTHNDYFVYHINGSWPVSNGVLHSQHLESLWSAENEEEAASAALKRYILYQETPGLEPDIRFSWEEETPRLFNNANLALAAETLVVIGYSFPLFNRNFDRRLFAALLDFGLKRIYLGLPEKEPRIYIEMI